MPSTIGIELEYPRLDGSDELYVDRGRDSNSLQHDINRIPGFDANPVYDGTVGLEVVSGQLAIEDAPSWYAGIIDHIEAEWDTDFQPTGLMRGGNTAGLHMHLSPMNEDQARTLFEMSQEPWAKVLFCSSIAVGDSGETWPVFRGGRYCRMNYDTSDRYACVNQRGPDHYEWRMPEPMDPEHLEIVVEFLRAFEQGPREAREYAQRVLDDGDERITSIKRAEHTGMDIEGVPTIEREAHPEDPEDFYHEVEDRWTCPEIYRVEYNDDSFYVFESRLDNTWEVRGVEFSPDTVLHADELEPVADEMLEQDVQTVFQNRRNGDSPRRETEATQELKQIIKKKKGK